MTQPPELPQMSQWPEPTQSFQPTQPSLSRPSWWSRNWKWFVPVGCGGLFLLFAGVVALGLYFAFSFIRSSEPVQMALTTARNSEAVRENLGDPIELGYPVQGRINVVNDSGYADYTLPIHGPKGRATIFVTATRSQGVWKLTHLTVEFQSTGKRIDLLTEHLEVSLPQLCL